MEPNEKTVRAVAARRWDPARNRAVHAAMGALRAGPLREFLCPDHPEGAFSVEWHPPSRSWLLTCLEKPDPTSRNIGYTSAMLREVPERCFHHEHFDPEDWE